MGLKRVSSTSCVDNETGPGGEVDVADLSYLVDFLFRGGSPPPCTDEGNVDGLTGPGGPIDVADLSYLVDFLFRGGPPPPDCPAPSNRVFTDEYDSGVTYEAFAGSLLDAVQIDEDTAYAGLRSLIVTIPDEGNPAGSYSGGAFTDSVPRDLTGFNALTFWAKASTGATLNVAGIGNDNTGTSKYTAQVNDLPLSATWQKYVIPIPEPSKLVAESGLFFFAEGPEGGNGYEMWMDEIIFEDLATITDPRPALNTQTLDVEVGDTVVVGNHTVTFDVDGTDVVVNAMPGYFTFSSSDELVVLVAMDGTITAVGTGTATLTATLGAVPATGEITVNVTTPQAEPTTPAPTPTVHPDSVISLFSDAYTDHPVDTWSAVWDMADVEDFLIGADNTKKYTNFVFAGIEFTTTTVDASSMTHFHMDVWTPDPTDAPAVFKVKLVDFGADGVFGGGDDTEDELTFDENTMNTGEWISIDVPLASFTNLTTTGHLAQLIISGDPNTVYVDNIYFYESGLPLAPSVPAPTPTVDSDSVVSLFSDAYTNHPVDTWSAPWDDADVADYLIGSDNTKQYTNLVFAGIEFTSTTLDASAMTHFHMDVWTPDPTAAPAVFKVKLVDFGADGAWGGGDDVEHELTFDANTMETALWVGIDVPLTDFTNLTTTGHLAQLIIASDSLNTVYIDNIYFYDAGIATAPTTPAPTPSVPSADVISLFSDAYTDHPVDTWSAGWDMADVADYLVGSDSTKQYTNLVYAGVEFTTTTVDGTAMTHFHMDFWTADPTDAPAVFKIKLVDFGADGAWGGGDDVEHEITLDENTMNTGSWVSIELALADFTNLTTKGHLAQLIITSDPNTVFVDNVYFHK